MVRWHHRLDGHEFEQALGVDDAEGSLVLAMDRRSALVVSSADSLAAWMEALVEAVRDVRKYFAENFPIEEE